jgi:hypothetical protein
MLCQMEGAGGSEVSPTWNRESCDPRVPDFSGNMKIENTRGPGKIPLGRAETVMYLNHTRALTKATDATISIPEVTASHC